MNKISSPFDELLARVALTLLILSPTLAFFLSGAGSTLLYALVLISAISFWHSGRSKDPTSRPLSYWWVWAAAAACYFAAVLIAQIAHGAWQASSLEKAARMASALPVLYYFCKLPHHILKRAQIGFIAAALVGAAVLIFPPEVYPVVDGFARPNTSAYSLYSTVTFANFVMLYATLTLAALGWQLTRFRKLEAGCKIAIALIGYYGVLLSQTRTSLLALPAFLLIAVVACRPISWKIRAALVSCAIVLLAVASSSSLVKSRVERAYAEASECTTSPNTDSSICIRFQLLRAANAMFREHPIVGVGDGASFRTAMSELADRHLISPLVAKHWGETHNDVTQVAATYGLIGLIPFLFVMFVIPAGYYIAHMRTTTASLTASVMGLLMVMGFLAFGQTEMMFRSMRTVSVYVVFLALFLAMSAPPAHPLRARR